MPEVAIAEQANEETNFAEALGIAKRALGYIAKYRTPPTPTIFEVWFRYAENCDQEWSKQLSSLVETGEEVSYEQLIQVHHDFLNSDEQNPFSVELGNLLCAELCSVQSMIQSQLSAGKDFRTSIETATEKLRRDDNQIVGVHTCIETVLTNNEEMQKQLSMMSRRLEDSQQHVSELRQSYVESQRKLMIDTLTGVGSRRFFDLMMNQTIAHPQRNQTHFFLLLVDLDNFKQVNDHHGHAVGDRVLEVRRDGT